MSAGRTTLVLLNSIGNDADCWQFLHPTDGRPFLYPGHGTRGRREGWTHQQVADEVAASFDGLLDLVGMSVGGAVAVHVLARHPHRVRSVFIGCSGSISKGAAKPEALEQKRRNRFEKGELALRSGMDAVIKETLPRWFTSEAIRNNAPGVAYTRKTLAAMDPRAWYDAWASIANSEAVTPELLTSIRQPVTLVVGKHDGAAGLAGLLRAHELIPRSRLEILKGPHMLHLEEPLILRQALERHFAWVPTAERVAEPMDLSGGI